MKKSNEDKENRRRKQPISIEKGVDIVNKAKENKKLKSEQREEKVDKRKPKIVIRIALIVLLIIVGIIIYNRHILGITFKKTISKDDIIKIETTTSENEVLAYENEILVYSKGTMTTYNKYGKKTWEYTFDETFIPEINIEGKYIQVINKDQGYVYVFKNKHEVSRTKINGNIKFSSINIKGYSSINYSTSGLKSIIGIFNEKGQEKYKVKLKTSSIADVILSNNLRCLAIYEMDSSGISAKANIKLVDLHKDTNVKDVITIDGKIIFNMFFKNNTIVALCSDGIYKYDINSKTQTNMDISDNNLVNIAADSKQVVYVTKDLAKSTNRLVMKSYRGNVTGEVEFKEEPKYFYYSNFLSYVSNQKAIRIYNMWGKLVKEYESNNVITEPIIFNGGRNVAIPYSNTIMIFGI